MADLKRLSKFLALMLRHAPDDFGLTLDAEGFAEIDAVWAQVKKRYGTRFTLKDLDALLQSEGGKQRYQQRGRTIRAMYGHTAVSIAYEAVTPPEILYHGTPKQAVGSIRAQGLTAQSRQYVHLSIGTDRALDVASRHGKPVLLQVKAREAHDTGIVFYHPEPSHYLAQSIPPKFILFPDDISKSK